MAHLGIGTAFASTDVTSKISKVQATDIGDPFHTVFVEVDVTSSPCAATNSGDRFTIVSESQYALILAASIAGKTVRTLGVVHVTVGILRQ